MTDLTIIRQHDVTFYEDELTAVLTRDGRVFVSLTQMCNALGIDPATQRTRIRDHDVLGEGMEQMTIDTPGGSQKVYMLHADLVPMWLAGVRVKAVREEVRDKLKRYQIEAAKVLWEAFQEGRLTSDPELVRGPVLCDDRLDRRPIGQHLLHPAHRHVTEDVLIVIEVS